MRMLKASCISHKSNRKFSILVIKNHGSRTLGILDHRKPGKTKAIGIKPPLQPQFTKTTLQNERKILLKLQTYINLNICKKSRLLLTKFLHSLLSIILSFNRYLMILEFFGTKLNFELFD